MGDVICNTSPLQYLHQLRLLHLLKDLYQAIVVPPAVVRELQEGKALGVDLPDVSSFDWIGIRQPPTSPQPPALDQLGPGETEVLLLGRASKDPLLILDDALAREVAQALGLKVVGTLGVLLIAKNKGLVPAVRPLIDELHRQHFRLSARTREAVLKLANE